jgi:hypothetical protein
MHRAHSPIGYQPKPYRHRLLNLPDNLKGALPTVEEIELDLQQLQDGKSE